MTEPFDSSVEEIAAFREELDKENRKLVFTNGCFDLLHAGHVRYLAQARALGDALVVAVNGDESVARLKGPGRPVTKEKDRAEILCALRSVDRVVIFPETRVTNLIRKIRPHIYAKGGDYTKESMDPGEREALEEAGTNIQFLSLVEGRSTSGILRKMAKGGAKIAVFGSGKGSNFDALLAATCDGTIHGTISLVISDEKEAPILAKARKAGIDAVFIDPGPQANRMSMAAQQEIQKQLLAAGIDLVVLAGFLRVLKEPVLSSFSGRIMNIHPSLLPRHPGLKAWEKALSAGDSEAGCTVHLVNAVVDGGEILGQARVPVLPSDTAETLYARIQEQEHALYPRMVASVCERLAKGLINS